MTNLNTPVLLIVFNRPETTKIVFEAIRRVKPGQLFIAADGPRNNRKGEIELCAEVRQIVSKVDWDCQVSTLFRDNNIGCGKGPAEAISWFFSNVEKGIIIEDDCLPDESFFFFCEEVLAKYKNEWQIAHVAGTNLLPNPNLESSYFFSRLVPIWGWATWRRAWLEFDGQMKAWPAYERNNDATYFKSEADNVLKVFADHYKDQLHHSWDGAWAFSCFRNGKLSIIPKTNLVRNIGFGSDATHTKQVDSFMSKIGVEKLVFPIRHPIDLLPERTFDISYLQRLNSSEQSLLKKYFRKITTLINRRIQSQVNDR